MRRIVRDIERERAAKPPPRVVLWEPQPGPQTLLLSCPFREIFYGGARGGGKTDGGIGSWLSHAGRYGNAARGIWLRRTYPELLGVLPRMRELFVVGLGATYNGGDHTFTFQSGATLRLGYLDSEIDAEAYQGHSYTWEMFDECGNNKSPIPIDKLKACLRTDRLAPDGSLILLQAILTANPCGRGHEWIKKRYIDPAPPMTPFARADGQLCVYIPSKLIDNPKLLRATPGYADDIRAATLTQPHLGKAWLEGDWNAKPSGGAVQLAWFRRYDLDTFFDPRNGNLRDPGAFAQLLLSVDCGSKDKEINDPTAIQLWGRKSADLYLLASVVARLTSAERRSTVKSLWLKYRPHLVAIEDKHVGEALIQDLRADPTFHGTIAAVLPHGSKLERMLSEAAAIQHGRVYLPYAAPWLPDLENEVALFPIDGVHDDQVDAMSQALRIFRNAEDARLAALNS